MKDYVRLENKLIIKIHIINYLQNVSQWYVFLTSLKLANYKRLDIIVN